MIELYFWPTPNGYKSLIALEEFGLDYVLKPVNIFRGEQFDPAFQRISPNQRIPAIVDHAAADGPLAVFESGATLIYLAEQAGVWAGLSTRQRYEQLQWLCWQVGGLGPMMGQASHFINYAPVDISYARERYIRETLRLFGVLEARLADRAYLAGDYSIADIAAFPWVRLHQSALGIDLDSVRHAQLARWLDDIAARPAVIRAYQKGEPYKSQGTLDAAARQHLFGPAQLQASAAS